MFRVYRDGILQDGIDPDTSGGWLIVGRHYTVTTSPELNLKGSAILAMIRDLDAQELRQRQAREVLRFVSQEMERTE